jgi:hypothetical protein
MLMDEEAPEAFPGGVVGFLSFLAIFLYVAVERRLVLAAKLVMPARRRGERGAGLF